MHNSDKSQFYRFICDLPEQIAKAPTFLEDLPLQINPKDYDKIIINGMGGSAIAGDLLSAYLQTELKIPFLINRNYGLPSFVDKKTLVLSCSYSGDTEETIQATEFTLSKKATVIGIASGGKLKKLLKRRKKPFITIPEGYPPRQALGFLFFSMLYFLQHNGFVKPKLDEIRETIRVLENIREKNNPKITQAHNLTNHIAQKLYNKIPVLYTASDFLLPVLTRWRNQFNENSKVLAFSNNFPELNHNEIMGWEAPRDLIKNFNILLLRDKSENSRNQKRLMITREILQHKKIPIFEIFSEGKSELARMFSLIYIGDWISYYLALLYEKDPLVIGSIQKLKEALSKFEA
ncbi:MAG: bifunctional phosphoglucose/phosphomannose isomerase [Calditrichia bacterium]